MKVIYEVNLSVAAHVLEEYVPWLEDHIQQMLAIDGFEAAQSMKICEPPEADDRVGFTVQYHLKDRCAMEDYLEHHAARMRQLGADRFGAFVIARRRIFVQGLSRKSCEDICPSTGSAA